MLFQGLIIPLSFLPWSCWEWHLLWLWMIGMLGDAVTLMECLDHCLWLTDCSLGTQTNVPGARADSDLDVSHSIHLHQNQPLSRSQAAAALLPHLCIFSTAEEENPVRQYPIFLFLAWEKSHIQAKYWIIHKVECAPNLINQLLKGPFAQIQHDLFW